MHHIDHRTHKIKHIDYVKPIENYVLSGKKHIISG